MAKLASIIMIVFTINIMLYASGVRVFENDFLDNVFNTGNNETVELNENFTGVVPTQFTESGDTSSFLNIVDGLGAVVDFIKFIINLIFTPVGVFIDPNMPIQIALLIGLPLALAGVVAIIMFIRGVS